MKTKLRLTPRGDLVLAWAGVIAFVLLLALVGGIER